MTNIVVEFGNARLQAVADRYVHGEDVPIEQVRAIWRETGQFMVWDSPLYEQFFRTVREINAQRPRERRWRVLLGFARLSHLHASRVEDLFGSAVEEARPMLRVSLRSAADT